MLGWSTRVPRSAPDDQALSIACAAGSGEVLWARRVVSDGDDRYWSFDGTERRRCDMRSRYSFLAGLLAIQLVVGCSAPTESSAPRTQGDGSAPPRATTVKRITAAQMDEPTSLVRSLNAPSVR